MYKFWTKGLSFLFSIFFFLCGVCEAPDLLAPDLLALCTSIDYNDYNVKHQTSKNALFTAILGIFIHWYLCSNRYTVCVEFENVMKSTKKIVLYCIFCNVKQIS